MSVVQRPALGGELPAADRSLRCAVARQHVRSTPGLSDIATDGTRTREGRYWPDSVFRCPLNLRLPLNHTKCPQQVAGPLFIGEVVGDMKISGLAAASTLKGVLQLQVCDFGTGEHALVFDTVSVGLDFSLALLDPASLWPP